MELQLGHSKNRVFPQTSSLFSNLRVIMIQAGDQHTVILTDSHEVYTIGSNFVGQLGVGDTEERKALQHVKELSGKNVVDISCNACHHTLALTQDGHVYEWGSYNLKNTIVNPRLLTLPHLRIGKIFTVRTELYMKYEGQSFARTTDGKMIQWHGGKAVTMSEKNIKKIAWNGSLLLLHDDGTITKRNNTKPFMTSRTGLKKDQVYYSDICAYRDRAYALAKSSGRIYVIVGVSETFERLDKQTGFELLKKYRFVQITAGAVFVMALTGL